MKRAYNFNAGPSAMPLEVLLEAQEEFLNYQNTGMSIIEMSHRSNEYAAMHAETKQLLRELMENAPGAMSRDELLQSVWGYDFIGETRTLDMHIGTLRHKLGDESTAPRYIKTVRGVGYRFLGEVEKEG